MKCHTSTPYGVLLSGLVLTDPEGSWAIALVNRLILTPVSADGAFPAALTAREMKGGGEKKKENQEKRKRMEITSPPTPTGQHTNNNINASVLVLIISIFMSPGAHLNIELLSYLPRCRVLPVAFKNERQRTLFEQL